VADRPRQLDVWLGDERVAVCTQRSASAPILLSHTAEALGRWGFNLPLLSCSLPSTDEPLDATAFLDGYLPEGQARNDIAAAREVVASDTWMLMAHLGRDIAGALTLIDPDHEAADRAPGLAPYDDDALAEAVLALPERPLDLHDDSELSLAGVQDKLLLVAHGDGWARPTGGRASTHILKPEPPAHQGIAELEAESLRLAGAVGLTTITPKVLQVAGRPCLLVDRYDRAIGATGEVVRIHQEDLCQATGRDPRTNRGRGKYERHGGPGFVHAGAVLRAHARDADEQLDRLAGAMVFTVLIGNSDAHGKNLSLLHVEPGRIELAPLYDTVPTMLLDHLRVRCAMEVNGVHESLAQVTRGDLIAEMAGRFRWKLAHDDSSAMVDRWIQRITDAAQQRGGPVADYVVTRAASL